MIAKRTVCFYNMSEVNSFLKVVNMLESEGKDIEFTFIVGTRALSRISECSWEDTLAMAKKLRAYGKVFLQWDILMTQSTYKGLSVQLTSYWHDIGLCFDGLRVQDVGGLYWLKERGFTGEVHYICENGNHNLAALLSWYNFWPERITRLVLSPEFPAQNLIELKEVIACELEVIGAGNILLFYTPRHLVAPLYEDEQDQDLEEFRVFGTSEESPHKGFPIIDNGHGTFMFNTKELYIFTEEDKIEELCELSFRIDYPIQPLTISQWEMLLKGNHNELQQSRRMGQTKGFFKTNKTDVLFKKLKNHRLQERDGDYLGDVVDVKKKQHLAILIKASDVKLKVGDEIRLLSPEGREKIVYLKSLWDADREDRDSFFTGQIAFIPHVGGISVKTMVFRN